MKKIMYVLFLVTISLYAEKNNDQLNSSNEGDTLSSDEWTFIEELSDTDAIFCLYFDRTSIAFDESEECLNSNKAQHLMTIIDQDWQTLDDPTSDEDALNQAQFIVFDLGQTNVLNQKFCSLFKFDSNGKIIPNKIIKLLDALDRNYLSDIRDACKRARTPALAHVHSYVELR